MIAMKSKDYFPDVHDKDAEMLEFVLQHWGRDNKQIRFSNAVKELIEAALEEFYKFRSDVWQITKENYMHSCYKAICAKAKNGIIKKKDAEIAISCTPGTGKDLSPGDTYNSIFNELERRDMIAQNKEWILIKDRK